MDSRPGATPPASPFVRTAVAFEGGLGALALLLGYLLNYSPLERLLPPEAGWEQAVLACLGGLAATLPMGLLLWGVERLPLAPLEQMRDLLHRRLVPLFRSASLGQLALVAVAAGVGEELLFRGLIQSGLAHWWQQPLAALIFASLLFGVCHWLTTAYAVLAALIGLYLGGLLMATDSLLAPVVAHGAYDFAALVYLVRRGS